MNTEPNTEPKAEKFWEVNFTFINRKDCIAIVKAETKAQAEAMVESLSSDVLIYGPDRYDEADYRQPPTCEYEDETVEDIAAYGPLTEEDL